MEILLLVNTMNIKAARTDLYFENNNYVLNKSVEVSKYKDNNFDYHTIYFKNLYKNNKLKEILKKEIKYFIKKAKLSNKYSALIVGLGSSNHTADSVGPNVLNFINVNAFLEELGLNINPKISLIEPGVLGKTGIDTKRIVESVVEEIKPDIVILIDAFVTNNIDCLNHTIEITNEGIIPGSGIKGINSKISEKTLKVPVLVIGVPTALEVDYMEGSKKHKYLLSSNNIDSYVLEISKIVGQSLNEIFKQV